MYVSARELLLVTCVTHTSEPFLLCIARLTCHHFVLDAEIGLLWRNVDLFGPRATRVRVEVIARIHFRFHVFTHPGGRVETLT